MVGFRANRPVERLSSYDRITHAPFALGKWFDRRSEGNRGTRRSTLAGDNGMATPAVCDPGFEFAEVR
jgi:hypothetical protein